MGRKKVLPGVTNQLNIRLDTKSHRRFAVLRSYFNHDSGWVINMLVEHYLSYCPELEKLIGEILIREEKIKNLPKKTSENEGDQV